MLIRKPDDLLYSDVTPRDVFLSLRKFIATAGAALTAFPAVAAPKLVRPTWLWSMI